MEDLVLWISYGYFSFYFAGSFIGLKDNSLKGAALFGLSLGCISNFTGKSIVELLFDHK
jgi:hypothetical protein